MLDAEADKARQTCCGDEMRVRLHIAQGFYNTTTVMVVSIEHDYDSTYEGSPEATVSTAGIIDFIDAWQAVLDIPVHTRTDIRVQDTEHAVGLHDTQIGSRCIAQHIR